MTDATPEATYPDLGEPSELRRVAAANPTFAPWLDAAAQIEALAKERDEARASADRWRGDVLAGRQ